MRARVQPTMMLNRQRRLSFTVLAGLFASTLGASELYGEGLPRAVFDHDLRLTSNEGHVALKWTGDRESLEYQLQCDTEPEFKSPTTDYEGMDESTFQSGLPDGQYYFRVRARESDGAGWGPWSDTAKLVCTHHSMTLAWGLFSAGGVLFLLITSFVVLNSRSLDRFEGANA